MQGRKVGCMGPGMTPVQEDYCEPPSRPASHQQCTRAPCNYMWITGEWSQVGTERRYTVSFVLTSRNKVVMRVLLK